MKRFLMAGIFVLLASMQANASYINVITADALAGVEMTVTYEDTTTETGVFAVSGFEMAEYIGTGFEAFISGSTFGENGEGIWNFVNTSTQGIVSIFINAIVADIVFDPIANTVAQGNSGPGGSGRPFVANALDQPDAMFGAPVVPGELWGTLFISSSQGLLIPVDSVLQFVVDTDAVDVPAPAIFGLLLAVLGFAGFARRN